MIVGCMDTEHWTFQTVATTEDEARNALARGFVAHLVQRAGGTENDARENFCASWDREDATDEESFVGLLDEVYGLRLVELQPGEVARDFDPFPLDTR